MATTKIRELERGSSERVPIIGLTATVCKRIWRSALGTGMDDYLSRERLLNAL
jgi:CheY-like chemotaxis protein